MKISRVGFGILKLSLFAVSLAAVSVARGDCTLTATGNIPLPDLGPGLYKGFEGGLYPGGTSIPPATHAAAGLAAAAQIQPLNAAGQPDSKGTIVFTSVGLSNATQCWLTDGPTAFMPRANADPSKNPKVTLIDAAEPSKDAPAWADPTNPVWQNFQSVLNEAGVTAAQVQVAWAEWAIEYPATYGAFPKHAQVFQADIEQAIRNLKAFCPNLRILYISTRERSYTDDPTQLNPEPFAYETGFGVKWAIADQINGTGNLNFDATKGPVVAPYITWGPYFWADGLSPRSDGLIWNCDDTEDDFIHPSASGSGKMASQLLAFFKTDPTSKSWFLRSETSPISTTATTTPTTDVAGTYFHFTTTASDSNATITSYQWTFGDGTFSDLQNPLKVFKVPGTYTTHVTVTDSLGNYSTNAIPVTVGGSALLGSLLNVSTRGQVSGSNTVLIGGFIVHGTQPKKVLLRAIGPSLVNDGIGNALGDPMLELYDSTGAVIATNDNWQTTQIGGLITADEVTAIQTSGIAPTNPLESAILVTLNPGSYTAIIRGVNNSSGVALTELYDLDAASPSDMANLSTRGNVQTTDNVLIGGFIVGQAGPSLILVRALGPSLTSAGVTGALADPTLDLRNGDGTLIASNDNWGDTQSGEIAATGIAPSNATESAILQVLQPGDYTATVSGKNGGTGVALVEVYNLGEY